MLGIQDMRWMCRNVMAREKALFAGHPVAAVAATTEAIAARGLQADRGRVRGAAVRDRRRGGDEARRAGPARPSSSSRTSRRTSPARWSTSSATSAEGFAKADVDRSSAASRTQPVHQGYIEPHACLVSVAGRQGHDLELQPGPVHGPRHVRLPDGPAAERHPRHPRRDRRRLRRQDHRLPRSRWRCSWRRSPAGR